MNTATVSSSSIPDSVAAPSKAESARCPYLYPNGKRCSLYVSPAHSGFCRRHSPDGSRVAVGFPLQHDQSDFTDLSAELLPELSEFAAGADIRQFLARLLVLVTKGRISPRRASVLGYITNQLLHSHRAINQENALDLKLNPPRLDFTDWPRPIQQRLDHRDTPTDIPDHLRSILYPEKRVS